MEALKVQFVLFSEFRMKRILFAVVLNMILTINCIKKKCIKKENEISSRATFKFCLKIFVIFIHLPLPFLYIHRIFEN